MKNYLLLLLLVVATELLFAQVPQAVNYQAIARDAAGNILPNRNISLRFSINNGINPGFTEYQETASDDPRGKGFVSR